MFYRPKKLNKLFVFICRIFVLFLCIVLHCLAGVHIWLLGFSMAKDNSPVCMCIVSSDKDAVD